MKNIVKSGLNVMYNHFYTYRKLKSHGKHVRINRKHYCINGLEFISIGDYFGCGEGLWLEAIDKYKEYTYNPQLIIGNNVRLCRNNHIGCINRIVIGNDVLMGSNILIEDHSHGGTFDYSKARKDLSLISNGEITIGNNVWICDNVVILAGAHIGNNCVVAANSVVNKTFPDNCLIGGTPAKILKKYDEE